MELILGFVVGVMSSYWFMGGMLSLLLISECHESGWTYPVFAALIASIFITFDISFSPWWLAAYLPAGFLWSLWRYRKFVAEQLKSCKEDQPTDFEIKLLSLDRNIDRVTYWMLFWPTNMLIHLTQDIWEAVAEFIKTKLSHLYAEIRDSEIEKYKSREGSSEQS